MSTVTPSAKTMTEGQINKAVANYRALLEKHAQEIDSQPVQAVLGQPDLAKEMFNLLRKRVEAFTEMIVRIVEVDYDQKPEDAIYATNRSEYLNNEVVKTMPKNNNKGKRKVEVCFFPLRAYKTVNQVDEMLREHGLTPDPYAICKVNQEDRDFSKTHPNGTQWQDKQGNHCYVTFYDWSGKPCVYCYRYEDDWSGRWWVGGVREQSLAAEPLEN